MAILKAVPISINKMMIIVIVSINFSNNLEKLDPIPCCFVSVDTFQSGNLQLRTNFFAMQFFSYDFFGKLE